MIESHIPDEILSECGPVISSVASDMSRRYRRYQGCDFEDMSQTGWIWVFQHPLKMTEWYNRSTHSERDSAYLLARSLRNEMAGYGEDQKAAALGYSRDDVYYYTKGEVKDLLPSVFDEEAWLHPSTPDADTERRKKSRPSEGGNWVASLADVSRALNKLDAGDRDLLVGFHKDGLSNNMMAEEYGVSKQTMSDWHDKAIRRLVDKLGGPRPRFEHDDQCNHWSGRKAVSNEGARAMQSNYYEES